MGREELTIPFLAEEHDREQKHPDLIELPLCKAGSSQMYAA